MSRNVHKGTHSKGGGAYDTVSKFTQDKVSYADATGSHVPHELDDAIINREHKGTTESDLARFTDPANADKLPGRNDLRMMSDQLGKKQAKDREIEMDDAALLAQKDQQKAQQAESRHQKHVSKHHGHPERAGETEDSV